MKRIIIFLSFFAAFFHTSCSDEWLDPKPHSFYTPENVYTDKGGFESLILTMRKDLRADNTGERHFICSEMAASDLGVPLVQLDFRKLTPSSSTYYPFLTMFTRAYEFIKNSNVLISRIDNIEWKDENEKNALVAEALWHRAYWYYRLVNNYGDVPLILEELFGPKLDFATYSRWTILEKLEQDLEFAVKYLPTPESTPAGGVSAGAGYHLLTKVYLANMKYDKAIEAADHVINDYSYALMEHRFGKDLDMPEYNLMWDLHRPENFNLSENTETILACIDRFEAPAEAKTAGLRTMRNYNCGWWYPAVLDSEGKQGMVYGGEYKALYGEANPNLVNTPYYRFDIWSYKGDTWENTSDMRRADENWVDMHELKYNNPKSVDYGKPVNPEYFAALADTFYYTFAFPHYITYVPAPDPAINPMGSNGDWYIFRLAETFLLRAEAYYWQGNMGAAADDINKVRLRAKAKPVTAGEVTIDFIFDERARELFAEEPRHSELVRVSYMMAKAGMNGYTLQDFSKKSWFYDRVMKYNTYYQTELNVLANYVVMDPHHVLWPIPQSVITANTQGVINQNIGYDGADNNVPPLTQIE
ncbi:MULTISPECIES: RagB/SusD family nutrient uptake outer membrane protein [Parabacteroides]|uniref:Starch-binding associating with outer membrane n=1 Tax=Parabacteroides chinchillae TaxID=871327 RepID=A0A8G2F3G5_9BACT|nr:MULTISPECIES: RagB/SusD family nutrient uptake outer membrane protein [Parabacteroides]SEG10823.1 Starch-binding associating with outer membrane [Parabacteroides chinchillae]